VETINEKKRFIFLITSTLVAAGGTALLVRFVYAPIAYSQSTLPGPRTPFTVVQVEKLHRFPSGEYVRQEESLYSIASDGTEATTYHRSAPDGRTVDSKVIINTRAKARLAVDGLTESVTTTKLTDSFVAGQAAKPARCTESANPQRSTLLGYEVEFVDHQSPLMPNGGRHFSKLWLAPALECYPLSKIQGIQQSNGVAVVTNVTEVTSITRGEPAPEVFAVPAGYVERAPTEVFAEYTRRYPGTPDLSKDPRAKTLDHIYAGDQPLGTRKTN
jgi:hypothetical protein